jgi:hypothetical protein
MEINKLSTQLNGQINGSKASDTTRARSNALNTDLNKTSDKVSISNSGVKNSDELFASIELDKANSAAFTKLKEYKARINEYDAARQISPEAARETELGKMLNDPAIWEKMAENMFR